MHRFLSRQISRTILIWMSLLLLNTHCSSENQSKYDINVKIIAAFSCATLSLRLSRLFTALFPEKRQHAHDAILTSAVSAVSVQAFRSSTQAWCGGSQRAWTLQRLRSSRTTYLGDMISEEGLYSEPTHQIASKSNIYKFMDFKEAHGDISNLPSLKNDGEQQGRHWWKGI